MSGVTGLTLGKSKTERGTGDDLERQKVLHNDKSQLSESDMHLLRISATPEPSDRLFSKASWFPIEGAASSPSVVFEQKY